MALNTTYAWYIEGDSIALVEPSTSSDITSGWQTISTTGKTLRIYAIHLATDFNTTLTDDGKTYNLPNRFRRILADKAIALGYEDPRHIDLRMAAYFHKKCVIQMREMKKFARSNRQNSGQIVHVYF